MVYKEMLILLMLSAAIVAFAFGLVDGLSYPQTTDLTNLKLSIMTGTASLLIAWLFYKNWFERH